MYISSIIYTPQFKAAHSAYSEIAPEREFLTMLKEGKPINLDSVSESTHKTLFHTFVDNGYKNLLLRMCTKGYDFSKVLNIPNKDGKLPIDTAPTDDMKNLINHISEVCSMAKGATKPIPGVCSKAEKDKDSIHREDAIIAATKEFMSSSVDERIKKTVKEQNISANTTSDNTPNIDYFDAFQVMDDSDETTQVETASTESCCTCGGGGGCQTHENLSNVGFNLDGLVGFKLLDITDKDPQNLNDIIGRNAIKKDLMVNVVSPLQNASVAKTWQENNLDLPNGILFSSEKDDALAIVKALSKQTKIPVVIMDCICELASIKAVVENRGKSRRTIILLQGLDKIFPKNSNDLSQANTFRNNMREIKEKGGLLIATTDDRSNISEDILKSGVIDKIVEVKKPNEDDRQAFFKTQFAKMKIFKDLNTKENIAKMVELTDNLSYGDMTRILDDTARTAAAEGTRVDMKIFEEQLAAFSTETGRVPITYENKTATYDKHIKRIPISPGEMMSLDELGGAFEVKEWLRKLYVDPIRNPQKMRRRNKIPDGAIFYGPPGNGKSTFARVLARELKLPYYQINVSDIGKESLVGQASRDFKEMVQDLKDKYQATKEMSVLFLDELDSIGASRDNVQSQHQHTRELTDTLLQVLDNPGEYGIIVIGATNILNGIDSALSRRGRLGNHKEFTNPNQEEREDLIVKMLSKYDDIKEFYEDKDWVTKLAKDLDGFATSSIKFILDDAIDDYDLHNIDFNEAIRNATDKEIKNLLGELCGKTQLKQHVYSENAPKSFAELGGMDSIIAQLEEKVMMYWNPEIRKELIANKIEPPGGFMLEGPSGGGKTTLVETMALEMGVPLFYMELDEKQNMFVGGIDNSIKEIFEQLALIAKVRKGPVMLLFDEATRFFPRTDASQLGNHMLAQTEKLKSIMNYAAEKGIILAGTTNHINLVNQEVIGNPRRMGTVIHCGEPDLKERIDMLGKILSGHQKINGTFGDDDIYTIASLTDGYSRGDLSRAVKDIITQAIFKAERLTPEKVVAAFRKSDMIMHVA